MTNQAKIAVFALLFTSACLASPQQKPQNRTKPSAPAAVPPVAPATAAVAPRIAPTPEQMPATPSRVTMSNGMLSIVATNSTLGDVLNGIHKATGATIDAPPAAGAERVAVNIGPADPRDALQELFEGSRFDYIIVGSSEDDLKLQRVILTQRTGGALGSAVANNSPTAPGYRPPPPTGYQPPPDNDMDNSSEDESVYNNAPEPASPEQVPSPQVGTPGQMVEQNQGQNQNQPGQEQQQKTPEQLLQELQRMQRPPRSEQQQQQQQPPPQRD